MKKTNLFFLFTLLLLTQLIAQTNQYHIINGHGDLHVLYNKDNSARIISAKVDGSLTDTTFAKFPEKLKLQYIVVDQGTGANTDFEFQLHKRIKHSWRQTKPEKTLVVSDLHGHLDAFVAFLKGNGVVDDNLNWVFGKNQFVFLGDILDRGQNDNGIAWLLYKLEKEAEDVGGRLDFIIGNHEDLVLKDDIRYVHEDHLIFSAKAGIPYSGLYGTNTELGRWIRDSYLIILVGKDLFVHAGLSTELIEKGYMIGEMNELGWRYTGLPTDVKKEMHRRNESLFGNNGPLWYRGLASDSDKHQPIHSDDLDKILKYYDVDRIIVGHTEVDEIDWRYNGRVIAVNVNHKKNFKNNKSAGLLIEGDKYYSVNYTGEKKLLNPKNEDFAAYF